MNCDSNTYAHTFSTPKLPWWILASVHPTPQYWVQNAIIPRWSLGIYINVHSIGIGGEGGEWDSRNTLGPTTGKCWESNRPTRKNSDREKKQRQSHKNCWNVAQLGLFWAVSLKPGCSKEADPGGRVQGLFFSCWKIPAIFGMLKYTWKISVCFSGIFLV